MIHLPPFESAIQTARRAIIVARYQLKSWQSDSYWMILEVIGGKIRRLVEQDSSSDVDRQCSRRSATEDLAQLLLLLDLQRSGDWALWSYEDRELELEECCCVSSSASCSLTPSEPMDPCGHHRQDYVDKVRRHLCGR